MDACGDEKGVFSSSDGRINMSMIYGSARKAMRPITVTIQTVMISFDTMILNMISVELSREAVEALFV